MVIIYSDIEYRIKDTTNITLKLWKHIQCFVDRKFLQIWKCVYQILHVIVYWVDNLPFVQLINTALFPSQKTSTCDDYFRYLQGKKTDNDVRIWISYFDRLYKKGQVTQCMKILNNSWHRWIYFWCFVLPIYYINSFYTFQYVVKIVLR